MMAFATDRDLLVPEPNVFRDVNFASQNLAGGVDGSIGGTTFTSFTANFTNVGVDTGHVIVVNGTALEVISRVSATQLTVSRLRPDGKDGSLITPASGTGMTYQICSFGPQIAAVHALVSNAFGLHETGGSGMIASSFPESRVLNAEELARVEALGALHLVFAGACTLTGTADVILSARAELYRQRYDAARSAARALIDTNEDGQAEIVRNMNVLQFFRG